MLEELHVAGLGVIEEAWLEFEPGLNVLSGETGAGKTLVTVALALALGARANADLVRPGSASVSVEARFSADPDRPPEANDWVEEGQILLARSMRPDGRSAARIGGRMAPASALGAVGATLVEIHGQHQAERLMQPVAQMAFLDRFVGAEHLALLARYRAAHGNLRRDRARLAALDGDAREREREKDLMAYQVREIEGAVIAAGEFEALELEASRLAHADRIRELTAAAEAALGDEGAATDLLRDAAGSVGAATGLDPAAGGLAERAAALVAEADDLALEVRAYREGVDVDPQRLASVTDRLQALRSLERKYGDGEEGILAYLQTARARLASLDGQQDERAALLVRIADLEARASDLAGGVSLARSRASGPLASAITAELQELGMPGALLSVDLPLLATAGPDGAEEVRFTFSGGAGQPSLPLAKVASGGELSRTMLACRSVQADLDDVATLVFDEVDAGIGGRAAAAVGRRLAALAKRRQILVVTHLAQIAAHADRHFLVTKDEGRAMVRALADDERSAELARMLSGQVDDVSLAHARQLIAAGAADGDSRG